MIAVHAVPKTVLNLHFRGGYQPGSRGRKIKKGDNWNLQCINCDKSFPNRVILRKHYHTECKGFDVDIEAGKFIEDCENKENAMETIAEEIVFKNNNKKVVNDPEANITFRARCIKEKCTDGLDDQMAIVIATNDKKPDTEDHKLLKNIASPSDHPLRPKTDNIKETYFNGQKRKLDQIFPSLTTGFDQLSKIRKLEERPKNLYQSLSEDILQEKWHSLFDRVPNKDRPYTCPKCKISFKYKNKLEMHQKYAHCDSSENNYIAKTGGFKEPVKDKHSMPYGNVKLEPESRVEEKDIYSETAGADYSKDKKATHSCTLCPMSFRFISRMQRHMKNVHKIPINDFEQTFTCQECDLMWSSRASFSRHRRNVHGVIPSKATNQDKNAEKTQDLIQTEQQCNTPTRYAQNFNAADVMQYLRANLTCLNQTRTPVIQSNQNKTSRDQLKYEINSKRRVTSNKMDIVENDGKSKRTSQQIICDDNEMPLDLSMKTGSSNNTGSTEKHVKTENKSSARKFYIPHKFVEDEKRIIQSHYKDFLTQYGYFNA